MSWNKVKEGVKKFGQKARATLSPEAHRKRQEAAYKRGQEKLKTLRQKSAIEREKAKIRKAKSSHRRGTKFGGGWKPWEVKRK